jgi:uncharacterized protein (TIGR03083 family)
MTLSMSRTLAPEDGVGGGIVRPLSNLVITEQGGDIMAVDVWPAIFAERKALAADLDGISAQEWDTTSLCTQWTVRDVLAHMTATSRLSGASFLPKLIGSGFSLTRMQGKDIARERGSSPDDTLRNFKSTMESKGRPPGPLNTMLGETIIHSQDIRRSLGITHQYPVDVLVEVANFFKTSNLIIGTKRRIAGVGLKATDADWGNGDGPLVSGPMISLVMAMTGRKPALDDLTGDGVATLRERN